MCKYCFAERCKCNNSNHVTKSEFKKLKNNRI